MDKISYAIGLSMGQNLMGSGVTSLNYADLAAGIKDILEKKTTPDLLPRGTTSVG